MVDITLRSALGSDLDADQIDANFSNLKAAIEALVDSTTGADNIVSITVTGTDLFFHKNSGDTIGPIPIPVIMPRWRGEWAASTGYTEMDFVNVATVGLYVVLENHTSALTFDENATGTTGSLYKKLIAYSGASGVNLADLEDVTLTALADGQIIQYDVGTGKWLNVDPGLVTGLDSLSDVTLTSPADKAVLRYVVADLQWEDVVLGTMADQNASAVAITGGTITGLADPTNNSDVATKHYADLVGAGGLPAIADGDVLVNMTGGSHVPAGVTLSDFFDYVLGNAQGNLLFRGISGWVVLPPGMVGQFLATGGAGADPLWDAPVGSGTVTSVSTGTGLTGGPITGTGTVSLDSVSDSKVLANISGATAAPTPTGVSALIDHAISSVRGTLLYRNATDWVALLPGTAGKYLKTQGASADPMWDSPAGSGTVTSIATGAGLTGGPITSAGTVSLDSIANLRILANFTGSTGVPVATTLAAILDSFFGTTRGSVLYRGASAYAALGPGTSGQVLKTNGAGADPSWANSSSSSLAGESDVSLSSPANDDLLWYQTSDSKWHNATLTAVLDAALGAAQGDIVYRDGSTWTVLTPGTSGYVLHTGGAAANPSWESVAAALDAIASTQGDILYRDGSAWVALPPGTAGYVLKTGGAAANPSWESISAALDGIASTQGDILYRDGSAWVALAPGTAGNILKTGGAAANPSWESVAAALDAIASTQGDVLYRSGSAWSALAPGTAGQALTTGGAAANPAWATVVTASNYDTVVGGPSWKKAVALASAAALPACTYANGSSGVGATLTGNSNGALTLDGVSPLAGQRVLIKNQASGFQNGIYLVTQVGTGGTPFILTRATDFDGSTYFDFGDSVMVGVGTVNASSIWSVQLTDPFVFGTTVNTWVIVGSQNVIVTTTGTARLAIASVSDNDQLVYEASSTSWKNQRAKYIIGAAALSGVLTASQNLLIHRFTKAVTIPANFGAYLGHTSEAGGTANATGSTVINVDKAASASPNTFSNVGTITIGAGGVTPTFASSGGTTITFTQGDVLRIQGPASADATFANFYATLVGYET